MIEFTEQELKSKRFLTTVFVVFWLLDLALVLFTQDFTSGGVRLVLTAALMYFVLQGAVWAKWLMVVLCSIAALVCVGFALYIAVMDFVIGLAFLTTGVLPSFMAYYLVKNDSINTWFDKIRDSKSA